MSKRTSYGKTYCSHVRARPRLPCGRDFTRGRILPSTLVKIRPRGHIPASARTWRVRTDATQHPSCVRADADAKIIIIIIFFVFFVLVVVAVMKREKKKFGFRFSIPKIPKIPKPPKLRGRSREKKKVFSA
jgi:hypothetical protein